MKYLIHGGLGFLGSEVCRKLLSTKYPNTERVTIIDDNSKGYGTTNIADFMHDKRFQWLNIDLTKPNEDDAFEVRCLTADANYVLNFAALIGGIGYFNKIPADILRNNNLINTTVMDAIIRLPITKRPHYLYMSSSMVFESATEFPSKEEDVKDVKVPITAYGFSKLSGEFYCKSYAQQHGLKYTIIRPFNAVGPERPDPNFVGYSHVIPDLICKIQNGQGTESYPLLILGDGKQVRHYTDVREIADGVLTCLHNPDAVNEDFNVAIHVGHTVLEVANIIWETMRPGQKLYIKHTEGFKHDVQFRSPDIQKMKRFFNWTAKNTLEDIMPEIVESVVNMLEPTNAKINP